MFLLEERVSTSEDKGTKGFIQAKGQNLIDSGTGKPVHLRGVNLSNDCWDALKAVLNSAITFEHYSAVKKIGFNTVRLNINYAIIEESPFIYRQKGWEWLDRNIEWAKKSGLYVILDMHIPMGAAWWDVNKKRDFSLWTDTDTQKRFIALWENIARRYAGEAAVAAYDILNEPITNDHTGDAWRTLAKLTVEAVRKIDKNHLIIIEKLYGTNGIPEGTIQFPVNDDNIMYDFHFYEPMDYSHQYAKWINNETEGGRYPEENSTVFPQRNKDFLTRCLDGMAEFGRTNHVPMNVGEFGLIYHCYRNNRGGINWARDMLDIMLERNLNFQCWDFHSSDMGIYLGDAMQPICKAKPNKDLTALLKQKLK